MSVVISVEIIVLAGCVDRALGRIEKLSFNTATRTA